MRKSLLGITLKFPEPGKVKTRLAKDIGDFRAAAVSRSIAEEIIRKTKPAGEDYERIIFFSPAVRRRDFEDWLKGDILLPQRGRDIGTIMANAFREMFRLGAEKALLVGADIPDLSRDIVNSALEQLDYADIVIGPASDGGYYLIGMKKFIAGLFHGISWSTGRVLKESLCRLEKLGLTYKAIETLSDVDTIEDLAKFKGHRAHI